MIELLIVVAIILIIAAIAIPNLLRSRMAANQASAVSSLRTYNTAEVTYSSTFGSGFSATLSNLGPPAAGQNATATSAGLVDSILAGAAGTATKSGYSFTYAPAAAQGGSINQYTITANPSTPGTTGTNYYFTDDSNVIRFNSTAPAAATDSPIGN